MTSARICTIGDEILIGQITDTNSRVIAKALQKAGVRVESMVSVGDTKEDIASAIDSGLKKNSVVIVTGGLGPTKDDITKSVVYDLSQSRKYVTDSRQLDIIHKILSSRGLDVLDINLRQASVPENCDVIPNRLGTAPVMVVRFPEEKYGHKAVLYSLPGVPFEAEGVLDEVISDIRSSFSLSDIRHRTVMTYGIAESALARRIAAWEDSLPSCVRLAYLPNPVKGVALRLSVYWPTGGNSGPEEMLDSLTASLKEILGDTVYADREQTLQGVIGEILRNSGKTVSTAESCTGGMIASLLTSVPGASEYYLGSVVSYSNSVKENVLGVPHDVIAGFGAVSQECVAAMAKGVRRLTGSDFSVATSGIAGPGGGSEEKPAGLVWVGVSSVNTVETMSFRFGNDRIRNIERFSASALDSLRKFITRQLK